MRADQRCHVESDAVLPYRFGTNVLPSASLLCPEEEGSTLLRNYDFYWQKWQYDFQMTAIDTDMGVKMLQLLSQH